MRHIGRGLAGAIVCLTLALPALAQQPVPDFTREVRPILADHCLTCHGPDEKARKANLRLDLRDHALKGGKSKSPAITPNDPAKSELFRRITTSDQDDLMPPPDAKKPIT